MTDNTKKRNAPVLYDVKSEAERIKTDLEKLSKEKPGVVEKGGKKDVIFAVKDEIMALIKRGYTPQQIAAAIRTDSFDIIPKTITEIANKSKSKKLVSKKDNRQNSDNKDAQENKHNAENKNITQDNTVSETVNTPSKKNSKTITIKEDNPDL